MYIPKDELEGLVKPTTLSERPINPRTGYPYTQNSKRYWIWYHGLSESEQSIIADLEAQDY